MTLSTCGNLEIEPHLFFKSNPNENRKHLSILVTTWNYLYLLHNKQLHFRHSSDKPSIEMRNSQSINSACHCGILQLGHAYRVLLDHD